MVRRQDSDRLGVMQTLVDHFGFTPLDIAAIILFAATWLFYQRLLDLLGRRYRTINFTMKLVRRHWMQGMAKREMRMADAALLGHVMNSTSFFASTTVLVAAALVGALASLDSMQPAIEGLDFTVKTSRALFELKMALPLVVFVSGFFSFTWALRQFNYAIALIGATPPPGETERDEAEVLADLTAAVLSAGAESFNAGVRAYYFASAGLFWFGGPIAFMVAIVAIIWILLRRQISSHTAVAIRTEARKLTRY